jgi:glycosyltransferase involved in cell wall biosynthesis
MSAAPGRAFWDGDITLSRRAAELHNPRSLTAPYDEASIDLTVFVSCYNEEAFIVATLDTVRAAIGEVGLEYEIIVIDDASTDASPRLVAEYIAAHPDDRIVLRVNRANKGLAQNYVDAAFLGKGKYLRLACGDNAEPREAIVAVLRAIGEADIIVPYYTSSEGKGWKRILISNTYTRLVNLVTGFKLHYYNGQAVHYRHNVLRWHSNTRGFGFQADILCFLLAQGFSYKEVPIITIEQRRGGSNAITLRNFLSVAHTLTEIINRRLSNRLYRRS